MKSLTSRCLLLISLLWMLLICPDVARTIHAQDLDNVTITGRVMDQNGASIPGAEVLATLVRTGGRRSTTTDAEGRYRLFQLAPGNYLLRVTCTGFEPRERADLISIAGQTLQLDLTLRPENLVVQPIVVAANESSKVDTTRTVVGATIARNELDSMPIAGRSALDLVFTLPGVTE